MPSYHFLEKKKTDIKSLPKKIKVQRMLGVPYEPKRADEIRQGALDQAMGISEDLKANGAYVDPESQIVALIAYLQKLGTYKEIGKDGKAVPLPEMGPGVPDDHRPTAANLSQ